MKREIIRPYRIAFVGKGLTPFCMTGLHSRTGEVRSNRKYERRDGDA